MKTTQTLLFLFILAAGAIAMASGSAHGGGHGFDDHTQKTILWQTFNVAVMFSGLIYFLRRPVKQYFAEKKNSYIQAAEKADQARQQAEQEKTNIQVRLTKLESTADESVSRARAEAADMRNQLIAEAEALSKRIKDEAAQAARIEVERAKNKLRDQLISEAIKLSQESIQSKVSTEDHRRLQGDFIHNIRTVQQ